MNFLALRPNAGPTQTHVGYRSTPYDFPVHVDHVFFEDNFFVFRSILHRCVSERYLWAFYARHFQLPDSSELKSQACEIYLVLRMNPRLIIECEVRGSKWGHSDGRSRGWGR